MQNVTLAMYVGVADRKSAQGERCEISVTATVGGVVVSGVLVGQTRFLELFKRQVAATGAADDVQGFLIAPVTAIPENITSDAEQNWAAVLRDLPTTLHLRDVKIFSAAGVKTVDLWQCRLSDVSGFSFEPIS